MAHMATIFGIMGNIVSFLVYLAPLPTFYQIIRAKSTMGFDSLPYIVALFSSMLWMYYAFIKTNSMLLITINSFGCLIESIYILIFLFYANGMAKARTGKLVGLMNFTLFSIIFLVTFLKFEGSLRTVVVGWICVVFSVCVFVAPLSIVVKVVRTKSVEFMPFQLSFFLTLSAIMWFGYGMFKKDICITIPNVLGFFLGALQMIVYAIFRNRQEEEEEEDEEDPSDKDLTEQVINVTVLGAPEVHPAHESGNDFGQVEENEGIVEVSSDVPCALNVEPSQVNLPAPVAVSAA